MRGRRNPSRRLRSTIVRLSPQNLFRASRLCLDGRECGAQLSDDLVGFRISCPLLFERSENRLNVLTACGDLENGPKRLQYLGRLFRGLRHCEYGM
jgi:hypothetical protein